MSFLLIFKLCIYWFLRSLLNRVFLSGLTFLFFFPVLPFQQGRRFLSFLFSWNVNFIKMIHGTVKNQLQFFPRYASQLDFLMIIKSLAKILFVSHSKMPSILIKYIRIQRPSCLLNITTVLFSQLHLIVVLHMPTCTIISALKCLFSIS